MLNVINGLKINQDRIRDNIEKTAGQIYSEFVLEALVKKGIPRLSAYRDIQRIAFKATEDQEHFYNALMKDSAISQKLSNSELKNIFNAAKHLSASETIITKVSDKTLKKISKLRT
jgi:adenylosuccinate lyase